MRKPSATDFEVKVPDVGTFQFARRTMKDEISIQAEFARRSEGAPITGWLFNLCNWTSTLKVLTVQAPPDWDVDELDPLDPESFKKMEAVFLALRDREQRFRGDAGKGQQAPGQGAGEDDRVLVSPEVQPDAE